MPASVLSRPCFPTPEEDRGNNSNVRRTFQLCRKQRTRCLQPRTHQLRYSTRTECSYVDKIADSCKGSFAWWKNLLGQTRKLHRTWVGRKDFHTILVAWATTLLNTWIGVRLLFTSVLNLSSLEPSCRFVSNLFFLSCISAKTSSTHLALPNDMICV